MISFGCGLKIDRCFYDSLLMWKRYAFFAGPPTAEEKELTQVARMGSDIRLVCPMSGSPTPMITWKKDGETINSVTWDRFRPSKKSLKVRQVDKEDTGIYICKGTNGFGTNEVRINLIVIGESEN